MGHWVWVFYPPNMRSKFTQAWQGPYLVIKVLGEVNYIVQKEHNTRLITLHVDHMKSYSGETPETWL